jgi:ADP-ribosylglycohydrolase
VEKGVLEEKFCGCLLGLACGDAMGMPTEGMSPYEVYLKYQKIDGFYGKDGLAPGSYTGVTQLALLECVTIVGAEGKQNQTDFRDKLLDARKRGKKRWREPFDLGLNRQAQWSEHPEIRDSEFITRVIPIGLLASNNLPDDQCLLTASKQTSLFSTSDPMAALAAFSIAWVVRELVRNSSSMESLEELCIADLSMIARLAGICRQIEELIEKKHKIDDKLSLRLDHVRKNIDKDRSLEEFSGVNGNSWKCLEAVPLALFCFLKGPDDLGSVRDAATIGGASPLIAGLTGAMIGCYSGTGFLSGDTKDSIDGHGSIMEMSRRLAGTVRETTA